MAGGLSSLVLLVLSSSMLVGGQTCSLTSGQGVSYTYYLYYVVSFLRVFFMHPVTQFHFCTVNVSAESVGGTTPGARVTWNTTVPPECVAAVRVEFRTTSHGPVVATNTATNTSQTEVIQTGLQCITYYYVRVIVIGDIRPPGGIPATPMHMLSPRHSDVQVFVGGKVTAWMFACDFNHNNLMVDMQLHRSTYPSWSES